MPRRLAEELIEILPKLRRFAFGLTGSDDRADDLVQAACERALQRAEQWTPGSRLDSWLYRIVQNIFLDECRAHKVRVLHAERTIVEDHQLAIDGEAAAVGQITLAEVRMRIAELPEGQRAALLLVCVEGLSYRDAAEVLSVPLGTLMSRLGRARQSLMQERSITETSVRERLK